MGAMRSKSLPAGMRNLNGSQFTDPVGDSKRDRDGDNRSRTQRKPFGEKEDRYRSASFAETRHEPPPASEQVTLPTSGSGLAKRNPSRSALA